MRRLISVIAATVAALPLPLHAADSVYPSRPVRMIVPYPPGGYGTIMRTGREG